MSQFYVGHNTADWMCASIVDVFGLYHPYIGDKATLYYLYLASQRDNETGVVWKTRREIVEKFRFSRSTIPLIERILNAVGLVTLKYVFVGRGQDKIVYIVHDPLTAYDFTQRRNEIIGRLRQTVSETPSIAKILGKESGWRAFESRANI